MKLKDKIYISIGTNIGDLELNIENVFLKIEEKKCNIIKKSNKYITKAWGYETQPDFLNMVIEINTILKPLELLKTLMNIEKDMGRNRKKEIKWGPRIIDLDILYYKNEIINLKELIIPHPYISERKFVLEPLNEIAKDFIHPILNKNTQQLLNQLNSNFVKK